MSKLQLFHDALARTEKLSAEHSELPTLRSIEAQLRYLIDLASGATIDRSRLPDIILGIQAAREVEPLDPPLAELLYQVAEEAKKI